MDSLFYISYYAAVYAPLAAQVQRVSRADPPLNPERAASAPTVMKRGALTRRRDVRFDPETGSLSHLALRDPARGGV
jgi:hypothetical protein